MGLLESTPVDIGMVSPITLFGTEVILTQLLGIGGSSTVFTGSHPRITGNFVVKVFKPSCVLLLQVEKENLSEVDRLGHCVTHAVATSDDETALFLQPKGKPWAFTSLDYSDTNYALLTKYLTKCII